jgi:hypothetical protein
MERSTLAERQGRRGRKHVPHREFRAQADATRLELDGFKAVNTEELDKVKASRDKYKTVRSRHAAYQRTQKTYRPLNRKCQKRLELPDSQSWRGTSGIEQS